MQEESFDDFLRHYGVKGMKWGVRKDRKGAMTTDLDGGAFKGAFYVGNLSGSERRQLMKIVGEVRKDLLTTQSDKIENLIKDVTEKHSNLSSKSKVSEWTKYYDEVASGISKIAQDSLPEGLVSHVIVNGNRGFNLTIGTEDFMDFTKLLEHSDNLVSIEVKYKKDSSGFVVGIADVLVNEAKHSEESFDDFLMHYGVLGMKWGVRKDRKGRRKGSPTAGTPSARHKKNRKGKKSRPSPKKLTDTELQEAIVRLRLEKEFNQLTKPQRSVVSKLLSEALAGATKGAAKEIVQKRMVQGGDKAIDALIKTALKATVQMTKQLKG